MSLEYLSQYYTHLFTLQVQANCFGPCKLNPILRPLPHFTWKDLFQVSHFHNIIISSQCLITQSKNFQALPLSSFLYFAVLTEYSHAVDTAFQAPCRELYFAVSECFFLGCGASPRTAVHMTVPCTNQTGNLQVTSRLLHHKISLEIYP